MRDMPIRPRRGAGDRVLPCNQDAIPVHNEKVCVHHVCRDCRDLM